MYGVLQSQIQGGEVKKSTLYLASCLNREILADSSSLGGVSLPVPAIDASTSNFQPSSGSFSSQTPGEEFQHTLYVPPGPPVPPCAWTGMTWTQYQSYG